MAKKVGVQVTIKKKQPGATYIWCVAHRLELAVLDAIKNDNYLTESELMINTFFFMYHQSPKLCKEFHDLAGILDEKVKRFAGLKKVGWLVSKDRALKVTATNHKTLCNHLENISNYEKTNDLAKAEGLVKKIKSLKVLA